MRLCALLLACMAISPAFAYEIYANTPQAGEDLQVLVEGAGNATVEIISPEGQEFFVQLQNGQGRMRAETAGMWLVEFDGQRKAAMVSEREFGGGKAEVGADWAQIAAFSFALLFILVSIAFAAWKNFYKNRERIMANPQSNSTARPASYDAGLPDGSRAALRDCYKPKPDVPKTAKRKLERA